ncbi:hypothetical protein Brsp07_04437 [Brucella sp. NBRC 14130]
MIGPGGVVLLHPLPGSTTRHRQPHPSSESPAPTAFGEGDRRTNGPGWQWPGVDYFPPAGSHPTRQVAWGPRLWPRLCIAKVKIAHPGHRGPRGAGEGCQPASPVRFDACEGRDGRGLQTKDAPDDD